MSLLLPMFHFLKRIQMKIKRFIFEVSNDSNVCIKAESMSEAVTTFKVVYGEFLFNQVSCIWIK